MANSYLIMTISINNPFAEQSCILTLCRTIPPFKDPNEEGFRKHCRK